MTSPRLILGERALSVREFVVEERLNQPFLVNLLVRADAAFSVEAHIGEEARLEAHLSGNGVAPREPASWTGNLVTIQDVGGDAAGHRLFQMTLAAKLWSLSQNRNYRVFQQIDEVSIACQILREWGIPFELEIDPGRYKKRKLRIQYGESDLAFMHRMLEEAGVSYAVVEIGGTETVLLADEPQEAEPRAPIPYFDSLFGGHRETFATALQLTRTVRPARYLLQDLDYRRPNVPPRFGAHARSACALEQSLERFHYVPGVFACESEPGETPVADDKGAVRVEERFAKLVARSRLEAKLADRLHLSFDTNAFDVQPGSVVVLEDHDDPCLAERFLVFATRVMAVDNGDCIMRCDATSTRASYRPPLATMRPEVHGIESATIVGPPGSEVHTDEFGRIRVQFHWDRAGSKDDNSSCWLPVSQPWAGAGYGSVYLPRVGQEVLVQFMGGNPDLPVVTGRVYTGVQRVPYELPENNTVTVIAKTCSFGGSGGYNEIKADDRAGAELLSFRAERDLETVVGANKRVIVGGSETREFKSPAPNAPRTVQTNQAGLNKMEVGPTHLYATADELVGFSPRIHLTTGSASITLEGGTITIKGDEVDVHGKPIKLNC